MKTNPDFCSRIHSFCRRSNAESFSILRFLNNEKIQETSNANKDKLPFEIIFRFPTKLTSVREKKQIDWKELIFFFPGRRNRTTNHHQSFDKLWHFVSCRSILLSSRFGSSLCFLLLRNEKLNFSDSFWAQKTYFSLRFIGTNVRIEWEKASSSNSWLWQSWENDLNGQNRCPLTLMIFLWVKTSGWYSYQLNSKGYFFHHNRAINQSVISIGFSLIPFGFFWYFIRSVELWSMIQSTNDDDR